MKLNEIASSFENESLVSESSLHDVSIDVEGIRYLIEDEIYGYLDDQWRLACEEYKLDDGGVQKAFGQLALLAGGVHVARQSGRANVGVPEIQEGWNQLWVCGIGVPPHQCIGKKIIDDVDAVLRRDDFAGRLLNEAVAGIDLDSVRSRSALMLE